MTLHVELPPTHPGFCDPEYRARRDAIATLAQRFRPGDPLPRAPYTDAEHAVWRALWAELQAAHADRVCAELLACERRLALPGHRIPQLCEVEATLVATTGFRLAPVAGLVPARRFLSHLADGRFLSTQYIRHASRPRYTPEPDVIHELVGHAGSLAHPGVARLSRRFGQVARRLDDDGLRRLERVYWFTLEFGLCLEHGRLRAVGAGLLSSVGELAGIETGPTLCDWDLDAIAATPFDTSRMQDQLFVAPSFGAMLRDLERWLAREEAQACGTSPAPRGALLRSA
ncbi:MAG: hypothetical protein KDK70_15025 [Myxococcales bacterium]|nr:hypothetical protein [Myxococcales bacterium]